MPPACGRERWYAVPKGGKRFEERGLRERWGNGGTLLSAVGYPLSAGGSQTVRLQTGMVLGNVFPTYGKSHKGRRFLDSVSLRSK